MFGCDIYVHCFLLQYDNYNINANYLLCSSYSIWYCLGWQGMILFKVCRQRYGNKTFSGVRVFHFKHKWWCWNPCRDLEYHIATLAIWMIVFLYHILSWPIYVMVLHLIRSGISLVMCTVNEWFYNVMASLIGWAHTQTDFCQSMSCFSGRQEI